MPRKLISIILVVAMIVTIMPVTALAENIRSNSEDISVNNDGQAQTAAMPEDDWDKLGQIPEYDPHQYNPNANILEEDTTKRTEYIKTFKKDDLTYEAVMYSEAVHYEENGVYKDIDNTLVLNRDEKGNGRYVNKDNGNYKVFLADDLSKKGDPVSIEKDGCSLSFKLNNLNFKEAKAAEENKLVLMQNEAAQQRKSVSKNDQFRIKDKNSAGAKYENVLDGVSLEYFALPKKVKENIVLSSYIENADFSFKITMKNLKVSQGKDGFIRFTNEKTGEEVFCIEKPYMVDAKGNYSEDVEILLLQETNNPEIRIKPDDKWLKNAAYPVKIDPTVVVDYDKGNILDTYVSEENPNAHYYLSSRLKVGALTPNSEYYTFIKYDELPNIESSEMIIDARQYNTLWYNNGQDDVEIDAHAVLADWDSETIDWNHMPAYDDSTIVDYEIVSLLGDNAGDPDDLYHWEITPIVRNWYETGNYGMMLKMSDDDNDYVELGAVDGSAGLPLATITYVSYAGLESYWSYHTQSIGRGGSSNINDYNGNLIYQHNDYAGRGNRMPVTLNHVYNSCLREKDSEFGDGWSINLAQQMSKKEIGGTDYYIYRDADGTEHYFKYNDNDNKWKSLDGLDVEFDESYTPAGSSIGYVKIQDKKDNYKLFYPVGSSLKGKLRFIHDRNGNNIQIFYNSSGKIDKIEDGVDREIDFAYNSDNLLHTITDPANRTVATFTYDSNEKLQKIKYADLEETTFTYDSNGNMTKALNHDGYSMNYTYSTNKPYRVIKVQEKSGSTSASSLEMEYGGNSTLFTDQDNREVLFQFNDWGHTVCVTNEESLGTGLEFNTSGANTNKVSTVGKTRRSTINHLKDSSFDIGNYWTFDSVFGSTGNSGYSTQESYQGNKSAKLYTTNNSGYERVYQKKEMSGNYFTLSGYLYADYDSGYDQGARLFINYQKTDGTWTNVYSRYVVNEGSWQRFVVPVNLSGNSCIVSAGVQLEGKGTVYVDNMQLEEGPCVNPYNMVQNADFSQGTTTPEFWSLNSQTETSDGITTSSTPYMLDSNVVKFNGKSNKYKAVYQNLLEKGNAGDIYTVGGWMKGDANELVFIKVTFNSATETVSKNVYFNEDITDWQYASGQVIAPIDYDYMRVYFCSKYSTNTLIYDGMHVYKETYGQSYTYDEDGNPISATDLANKTNDYEYNANNDVTSVTTPKGNEVKYTYDDNHNVESATTAEQVKYFYEYDQNGNLIEFKTHYTGDTHEYFIKNTTTYTNNGNSIDIVTDERGETTDYDYDFGKALLYNVKTPVEAMIRYQYDSNTDMMTRVYYDVTNNGFQTSEINNEYTYEDDKLSKITHNGFSYDYDYDGFGNRTTVKVGNNSTQTTLVSNTYDVNKGLLTQSDFGNGDNASYTYDKLNRLIRTYNDDAYSFRYYYNGEGNLGRMVDLENKINFFFMYDASGRLGMVNRDNGIVSWYKYDDDLNTPETNESFFEQIGDSGKIYESTYQSNKDGLPVYSQIKAFDGKEYKVEVTGRDQVNRVCDVEYKVDGAQKYKLDYYYLPGANGSDTKIINKVRYNTSSDMVYYSYDKNGNIATISDGTKTIEYYYDKLNQLTRENNPYLGSLGKTLLYTYDNGGNLVTKKEYGFETGNSTTSTAVLDTINFTYDSIWKDKLVSYDGKSITYDDIGNPLTYDNWTYTWKWGRRLATVGNTADGISTEYKYDDKGIRTYKKVTISGNETEHFYNLMGDRITYEQQRESDEITCEMYYAYDNSGRLYGFDYYNGTDDDGFYFYKRNIQGDIIGIIDETGNEVVTYVYDTWGKSVRITGTLSVTVGTDNPFRYRGYYYDKEISLYYLNQRYYNPEWGRFVNSDDYLGETGELLSHNLFAYCGNNPVNMADPSGRYWQYNIYGKFWVKEEGEVSGFDSANDAADWFCRRYQAASQVELAEYGAVIYKNMFTGKYVLGVTHIGNDNSVITMGIDALACYLQQHTSAPSPLKFIGTVHTHPKAHRTKFLNNWSCGFSGAIDNEFGTADNILPGVRYLGAPNGVLYRSINRGANTIINTGLPVSPSSMHHGVKQEVYSNH